MTQNFSLPKVCVIIPFFNSQDYLGEAIESVITQNYQNWEIWLVNDGSNDLSVEIANQFVKKFPHKIFLCAHPNNENLGASQSRNLGIEKSSSEFICFLDSDDIYYSNTLETALAAFQRCPESDAICGTLDYWYSWNSQKFRYNHDFRVNLGLKSEQLYLAPSLLIHNLKSGGKKPGITSIMLKRLFVESIGAFEGNFRYVSEDQVFWAKVALNGKIFVISDSLAKYRQHENSSFAQLIKNNQETQNWEAFFGWLENYLSCKQINNNELAEALKECRKLMTFQVKYRSLMKVYRFLIPLSFRFWLKDKYINFKNAYNSKD